MVESDWHCINKEFVEKMHSQDVQTHLELVVNDYEINLKQKLDLMMKQNQKDND